MSQELLTWHELLHIPVGTMLVFPQRYDIYPYTIVPEGTLAIMAEADKTNGIIEILPADPVICAALEEWDGRISFSPLNDGAIWGDDSPVVWIPAPAYKAPNG